MTPTRIAFPQPLLDTHRRRSDCCRCSLEERHLPPLSTSCSTYAVSLQCLSWHHHSHGQKARSVCVGFKIKEYLHLLLTDNARYGQNNNKRDVNESCWVIRASKSTLPYVALIFELYFDIHCDLHRRSRRFRDDWFSRDIINKCLKSLCLFYVSIWFLHP
jgi:hypothetical protein